MGQARSPSSAATRRAASSSRRRGGGRAAGHAGHADLPESSRDPDPRASSVVPDWSSAPDPAGSGSIGACATSTSAPCAGPTSTLLGHVNNVVYVDYLQEARVDMLRTHGPAAHTGELAEGVVVVRHEVQYVAPLAFRFQPVSIECWVTELRVASFTMAYEIFQDDPDRPGERLVHVRATTVLTPYVFATERPRRLTRRRAGGAGRVPRAARAHARGEADPGPAREGRALPGPRALLRRRRLRPRQQREVLRVLPGGADPADARLWRDLADWDPSVVVAQTDVDYKIPILFRPEPYDLWSWVTRVGERSMTIESEIRDGDTVLSRARSVIVFFDPAPGRSTRPPTAYRERLLAVLA